MRVIAGSARSLQLEAPEGMDTRPTTDRIKETLFNMIQREIPDCVFMDLFSGSGGIGIEALSRGAKHAYFVERDTCAFKCIQNNIKHTRMEDRATLLKQDVASAIPFIGEQEVSIIFMDPPYHKELEKKALELLRNAPYVTTNTMIIVEAALDTDFSYLSEYGYCLERQKIYKTNQHAFIYKI